MTANESWLITYAVDTVEAVIGLGMAGIVFKGCAEGLRDWCKKNLR